jgi:hypothetical protein
LSKIRVLTVDNLRPFCYYYKKSHRERFIQAIHAKTKIRLAFKAKEVGSNLAIIWVSESTLTTIGKTVAGGAIYHFLK